MTVTALEKPETKPTDPLVVLAAQLEQRAEQFKMVLPSHITPEKFQRTVITAVQTNPELMQCDRRSFLTSCMKAAQDHLLPDGREAALVPFKHRFKDATGWHSEKLVQYLPMVYGLRKKILQSDEVTSLFAGVVYAQEVEAGRFIYEEGSEQALRYKPILDPDFAPADADIVLAFSVATFRDGTKSFEVMRRWEIDKVRQTSQTGASYDKDGNPRDAKGPWLDWFPEMAKKSVLRRHSKSLPMSGDIFPDVEAEDLAFAAKSAAALLDSRDPDAPEKLPDETDSSVQERPEQPAPEEKPAPEDRPDPEKIAPDPQPEPQREPQQRPGEDVVEDETVPGEPQEETLTEGTQSVPIGPPVDELGITKDPLEAQAEDFIDRARRCELLMDFRKLEREAEIPLAQMDPQLAGAVDEEFARARLRLDPKARKADVDA